MIDSPRIGKDKTNLRRIQCGCQNFRCCVCATEISYPAYANDLSRPCLIKIDRTKNHSRMNSVICCGRCSGAQSSFDSLMDYYEHYHSGVDKPKKVQTVYPETISGLNRLMTERCAEIGIAPLVFSENGNFRFAPPSAVPNIVETQITILLQRTLSSSVRRKTLQLRGKKELFSEAQNHRCCYCGHHFSDYERHPRQATWEHIIPLRNEGPDTLDNLVLACSTCNNMRDQMDISAYEYYEWAISHLDEIEKRAHQVLHKRRASNLPPTRYQKLYLTELRDMA